MLLPRQPLLLRWHARSPAGPVAPAGGAARAGQRCASSDATPPGDTYTTRRGLLASTSGAFAAGARAGGLACIAPPPLAPQHAAEPPSCWHTPPLRAGQLLGALPAAAAGTAEQPRGSRLSVLEAPGSMARPESCGKLQPQLAAALTKSVYDAVKGLQVRGGSGRGSAPGASQLRAALPALQAARSAAPAGAAAPAGRSPPEPPSLPLTDLLPALPPPRPQAMPEAALQAEIFRLRDQEYPYYYAANKDRLPAVPDLSDMSGGLSNPAFFNFLSYIIWKVRAGALHAFTRCSKGRLVLAVHARRRWRGRRRPGALADGPAATAGSLARPLAAGRSWQHWRALAATCTGPFPGIAGRPPKGPLSWPPVQVVARGVTGEADRAAVCRAAGAALAQELADGPVQRLRAAAAGSGGRAGEAAVLEAVVEVRLRGLLARRRCCVG
jgi:hypothetical protein